MNENHEVALTPEGAARPERPLAAWAKFAIAIAPYLFVWLALRDGVPRRQRTVSLVWLGFFGFSFILGLAVMPFMKAEDEAARKARAATNSPAPPPKQVAPAVAARLPTAEATVSAITPVYTVVAEKDLRVAVTHRFQTRITLPPRLTREVLTANVEHALRATYARHASDKPGAIVVAAYKTGDFTETSFTAAKGVYAPDADWGHADANVPVERWRMTVELADEYFVTPDPLKYAPGTEVKLVAPPPFGKKAAPPGTMVNLMAGFPDVEPVAGTFAPGTVAKVVEGRVFFITADAQVPFYHVLVGYQGGWARENSLACAKRGCEAKPGK